jgi:hypothetical protein
LNPFRITVAANGDLRDNRILDLQVDRFAAGMDRIFEQPIPEKLHAGIGLCSQTDLLAKRYIAAEMTLRETRVACALERFRLRHGAFPETLGELVPAFLPSIPADVIDGQPVRYLRPKPDQFVLYSIGKNARDDGGSAKQDARVAGPFDAADWVWDEDWRK